MSEASPETTIALLQHEVKELKAGHTELEQELGKLRKNYNDLRNLKVGGKAILWFIGGVGALIVFLLEVFGKASP